jgi:hypothetical protein
VAADAGVTDLFHHDGCPFADQRLPFYDHASDRFELGREPGRATVRTNDSGESLI